jgi:hypothetical protein
MSAKLEADMGKDGKSHPYKAVLIYRLFFSGSIINQSI